MKAIYRCWCCGYIFASNPGPVNCVKCDCMFLTWLNYDELFPGSGLPLGGWELEKVVYPDPLPGLPQ